MQVKAAEFTSKKIAGLDIRARESYLALFEEVLGTNYDTNEQFSLKSSAESKTNLTSFDIRQAAINAEYEVFSSNKVVTTYRRKMAFLMAEVKRKTDAWELHNILTEFDPNKDITSKDSDIQIISKDTKCNSLPGGFQTALELHQITRTVNNATHDNKSTANKDITSYFEVVKPMEDCINDSYDSFKEIPKECDIPKNLDTGSSRIDTCDADSKHSADSSSACKMKEPNKSRDKDVKHRSSRDKESESKKSSHRDHGKHSKIKDACEETRKSSSKDSHHSRSSRKDDSLKVESETELEKALRRIKELEESNQMLANERIKELELENEKLSKPEKSKTSKDDKRTSTQNSYRKKHDKHKDIGNRSESRGTAMSDHKRKPSTASSSSNTSIRSPSFVKKGNVQSKLKTLGLSDSNGSSDEGLEDQKAAFDDLFGGSNSSVSEKQAHHKKSKSLSSKRFEGMKPAPDKSKSIKQNKPHSISERDSSSSPNLSDLEERIKVEEEVKQIVAEEREAECSNAFSNESSEHDQLAAWLGMPYLYYIRSHETQCKVDHLANLYMHPF